MIGADDAKDKVAQIATTGQGKRVLFVDNRDSFVHTLGDYVRQTGAEVVTVRAARSRDGSGPRGLRDPQRVFAEFNPDLVFISPGPGTPEEFGVPELVNECVRRKLPVFGVCLGLQGIVEALGGELGVLSYPMHGKESTIRLHTRRDFRRVSHGVCRRALSLALRRAGEVARMLAGVGAGRRRGHHGLWSTASCRWRPCSFTRSRS